MKDVSKILYIPRGSYFPLTIIIQDEDGVGINITGKTIQLTIKKQLNDVAETAIIQHIITSHVTPLTGVSFTAFTVAETDIDDQKAYQMEVRLITGSNPEIFDHGEVIFQQDTLPVA